MTSLGSLHQLLDGRVLSFDDFGDPEGTAVVFFHGTPDSRRSRHPDDALAERLGVRMIAVDRPGIGASSPHPTATVATFAGDVASLLESLGIATAGAFGWSAGAPFALAFAALNPEICSSVVVAAGLVPFTAMATPAILDDADGGRHMVAELGADLGPQATAEMAVPMLAPYPCDLGLAKEFVTESADSTRLETFNSIPGLIDAMALGVVDAVAQGLAGLTREVELQVEEPDVDWGSIVCPVHLVYAGQDQTAPVAFGQWWEKAIAQTDLTVHPTEGHLIAITRWSELLQLCAQGV